MPKSSNDIQNLNLCVVTFPLQNYVPLAILLQTLEPLADRITVITGNFPRQAVNSRKIIIKEIKHDHKQQMMLVRIPKYIITQLKIVYQLIKARNGTNIVIFYVGGTGLLLPILTAKLLRKKIILIIAGSSSKTVEEIYKRSLWGAGAFIFTRLFYILERLSCSLATRIVVYSPSLVSFCKLEKYQSKISIAHEHFLDFDIFRIENMLDGRDDLIGYIGRLSREKGVMNFIKAMPKVLEVRENARFLIIGQGLLRAEIEELLNKHDLGNKVSLLSWVPHDEMPKYINQLKLLVLPSYTEGLPNIVLEAMACGTPVLATPVGSIPDLITDGETGFIMGDNTAENIASSVLGALAHPELKEIATNAHQLVEQNYTYETAVAGYKNILNSLKPG